MKKLDDLIDVFAKLPGIGRKSAARIAFDVLDRSEADVDRMLEIIKDSHTNIKHCKICGNLSENDICEICTSKKRDKEVICVVEGVRDVIAFEKSDYVILTADNPRQEPLKKIYSEILSGRKNENTPYECVDDRKQAIERALELAQEGDILLFAGKGVEPYQVLGEEYIPYNEVETVVQALEKLGYKN